MKTLRTFLPGILLGALLALSARTTTAVDKPPQIASFSKPAAGSLEIIFHGSNPPFMVQSRKSLDNSAPWVDMPNALVSEVQPGVYIAWLPNASETDLGFFRVISEGEGGSELDGWTMLLRVSSPTNGVYFTVGEAPVVTVTILDTMATGLTRDDFSTLNLYAYGPQEPQKTVTASKLLNVTTNRSASIHHYINLKTSPGVTVSGTTITYKLQPVSTEEPGTYTVALNVVRAANQLEQVMKFANIQIGTATVETPVVTKTQCAECHEGPISGKIYMHHIDPSGNSTVGSWGRDFQPVTSCKACHNKDGYAAFTLPNGTKVADDIVRRAHGLHFGSELTMDFNINSTNGVFKNYTDVEFPADVLNCTKCHADDRWKTKPSAVSCGACHDNIWFGQEPAPTGYLEHEGGMQVDDTKCSGCHLPDPSPLQQFASISENHKIAPPSMDAIDISLTPPANGKYYTAGDKPQVTVVIKNDLGKAVDHTKVSDTNYSTAALFVYGPRARAVPVLTSAAKNVNSKLRASVSSSINGPWAINGKVFKIAVNGSAPQSITITGASNLVTAAEVAASLNAVVTNYSAKATASGTTGVSIKTTIQGAQCRFEIYNGDVTTAMGWKRGPNTVMEPDVTIAAGTLPSNDLRALTDPLDYSDPMVTRNTTNIVYQLDDVAGLPTGTYNVYVYQLPKAGKVPSLAASSGIGHLTFQVGSTNVEPKVATNCSDCHGDTIWHLKEGPIHPEPFDTDYCNACHDYGHVAPGDMFKNQGGTSLAGWSGFGAMPIVRRVHGVHRGAYLNSPEEIYANATKDTFGHIIFPQDIRNCTKCHAETTTWKEKPSRMACLACHDSTDAKMHGLLMTFMADPNDPYGPGAWETCVVCHGKGSAFSPDKVHAISNPYVPPYPRE